MCSVRVHAQWKHILSCPGVCVSVPVPLSTCLAGGYVGTKNYLLLETLDNVKSRIVFWKYNEPSSPSDFGSFSLVGKEPEAVIRGASLRAIDSDESDEVFWTTNTFTQPSTLALADAADGPDALSAGGKEVLRTLPSMFDATDVKVSQGMATSKDGTQVPYFMVVPPPPPGMSEDAPRPVLSFGYGGFLISLTPSYIATVGAGWIEKGGIFVVGIYAWFLSRGRVIAPFRACVRNMWVERR